MTINKSEIVLKPFQSEDVALSEKWLCPTGEEQRNAWLEEIAADPSEENVFSVKTLLSNGFKKKADGDYRKEIKQNGKQADNTGME